jgi:hypothetical protein
VFRKVTANIDESFEALQAMMFQVEVFWVVTSFHHEDGGSMNL